MFTPKKINPNAVNKDLIRVGRYVVIAGCVLAIGMALAIDSIKGLKFFDVFQSVLGFIAPPLSVVFLLTVFWKRTSRKAVNVILSAGSAFSLGTGIMYLWVFPSAQYHFWPHYLLVSFDVFAILFISAVVISLLDANPTLYVATEQQTADIAKPTKKVKIAWAMLCLVMVVLYLIFNGH
jgi:SSS family solute:Na+ symporter